MDERKTTRNIVLSCTRGRYAKRDRGRNVSHQIMPHANRLVSTLSKPVIRINNHPVGYLFVWLCVGLSPSFLQIVYCPSCYCTF